MAISFYNTTKIPWYPVKLNLAASDFDITAIPIIFSNGIKFNLHECLYSCNDISLNKKTGVFLTDLSKQSTIFNKKTNYGETEKLKRIVSPLADTNYQILEASKIQDEAWDRLLPSNRYSFTREDNFIFDFVDDYVTIEYPKTKEYLTWLQGEVQGNLIFFPKIYPQIDRQKFKYLLGEDSLILFQYQNILRDVVITDPMLIVNQVFNTNAYGLSSFGETYKGIVDKSCAFKLLSYKKINEKNTDIKDSFLAKYKIDPLQLKNDLDLD